MVLTLDLLGISRTGIMGINLFCRRVLIQGNESMKEVFASEVVIITTVIVREVIAKWGMRELLRKQIDLVQEQNKVCPFEEWVACDFRPQAYGIGLESNRTNERQVSRVKWSMEVEEERKN